MYGVETRKRPRHLALARLIEQALMGLNCQVTPSTCDEAPGLLAYGEPAGELIALSAGRRDTTLRNALLDVTTTVSLTAC